jgi:ubiquinone biosynthesis protein COQ4
MWNLSKIFKTTKYLMSTDTKGFGNYDNPDMNGQHRLDHIVNMYREMNIPFGPMMAAANRKTKKGRDILWARGQFAEEYVDEVTVPTLMNFDYLNKLAPNTVGAHYFNLIKNWGIEDLYNQRFKHEEANPERFDQEVRVNLSRHLLLVHDFWHVLFRYDTATMGEAMIQEVTSHLSAFKPPKVVSFFGTWKVARKTKSKLPWEVRKECIELSKKVDKSLFHLGPMELLEMDIQEVRQKYNIGVPVKYKQFVEQFGKEGESRMDTFHPQYSDVEWDETEVVI